MIGQDKIKDYFKLARDNFEINSEYLYIVKKTIKHMRHPSTTSTFITAIELWQYTDKVLFIYLFIYYNFRRVMLLNDCLTAIVIILEYVFRQDQHISLFRYCSRPFICARAFILINISMIDR